MTDKHFNAILAKNGIAREIRDKAKAWNSESMNISYIVKQLKEIEAYIGEANQPSVEDIITSPANSQI